jgi:CMP-N-acetylneuraminic acid synthetase
MISFFIPIRKGSKRVINKNTRPLPGFKVGLTEIKVNQLMKFQQLVKKRNPKLFKKFEFIVSTNCKKVKKFVKNFRWIKVHNRENALSTDDSLDKLCKKVPEICNGKYILWTHVTSPKFNENDYYNFLSDFFKKNTKKKLSESAFSADKLQKFVFSIKDKWISHNTSKKKWPRTQDLSKLYTANSAVFFATAKSYYKYQDRLSNKPTPIMSRKQSGYDIDDLNDFKMFQKELKNEN